MITVNGREMDLEGELSVADLLKKCNYVYPMIVVSVNGRIIPPEDYEKTVVSGGDIVDAIHMIAGGSQDLEGK